MSDNIFKDMYLGDLKAFKEYALSKNPELEEGYREKQNEDCKSCCNCCKWTIVLAVIFLIFFWGIINNL